MLIRLCAGISIKDDIATGDLTVNFISLFRQTARKQGTKEKLLVKIRKHFLNWNIKNSRAKLC